jgi:hypothetical protein
VPLTAPVEWACRFCRLVNRVRQTGYRPGSEAGSDFQEIRWRQVIQQAPGYTDKTTLYKLS